MTKSTRNSPQFGKRIRRHYATPKTGALLFVGLNPSFLQSGWKQLLKHLGYPHLNPKEFFSWPSPAGFDIKLSLKLEQLARKHYRFFGPHRDLEKLLGHRWDHFDLFALREKSQKAIKSIILSKRGTLTLSDFGLAQFEVFESLLELAKPAAVVIVNAFASQIYANQRKPTPDVEVGYYRDSVGGHPFPVFFSGIITGPRPLDRYSKQRLFWQVGKALNKKWSPQDYLSLVAGTAGD
jgi:hypothetical protein